MKQKYEYNKVNNTTKYTFHYISWWKGMVSANEYLQPIYRFSTADFICEK